MSRDVKRAQFVTPCVRETQNARVDEIILESIVRSKDRAWLGESRLSAVGIANS